MSGRLCIVASKTSLKSTLGKHSPARFNTYFKTHNNWMRGLKEEGFVLSDTLETVAIKGTPYMEMSGDIFLQGNLKMHVHKTLRASKVAGVVYVETIKYAYNLSLQKVGNIFRYDNAHAHYGHFFKDHKHEYEPPGVRKSLIEIRRKDEVPTLGEALNESRLFLDWHEKYCLQAEDPIIEEATESDDY